MIIEEDHKEKNKQKENSVKTANIMLVSKQNIVELNKRRKEEERSISSSESLISQEVKRIKRIEANRNKTAIKILFENN